MFVLGIVVRNIARSVQVRGTPLGVMEHLLVIIVLGLLTNADVAVVLDVVMTKQLLGSTRSLLLSSMIDHLRVSLLVRRRSGWMDAHAPHQYECRISRIKCRLSRLRSGFGNY